MLQIQHGLRYSAKHENSGEQADVGLRDTRIITRDGRNSICRPETRNTVLRGGSKMNKRIVIVFGILLGLAACSSAEQPPAGGPGGPQPLGAGGVGSRNAIPGSQQDLEASAGDRVFFA